MSSFASKVVDRAFRIAMMGEPKSAEQMLRHSRRVVSLVRPPAMLPDGVTMRKTTVANEPAVPPGVPAVCVSTAKPTTTVLYLHGGAFICGKFATYAGLCGQIAKRLNARVFWIDYRLAPEMPFPAAPDDAFNAYCALATDYPEDPLVVIGDSAGGNLTLSTLLRVRDVLKSRKGSKLLRLPVCAVAMSALVDFAKASPSRSANGASDAILSPRMIEFATELYLAGHDPKDPYASPIYGDLSGLPPMLLSVSDTEAVRDDSYRFASAARRAGSSVQLLSREDRLHAWPVLYTALPEARRDFAEIVDFMRTHLRFSVTSEKPIPQLRIASAK
jgi:epsilon-lactone hydrolase